MSMSQSIRATVKKNRGHKIPKTRYLTLRVDFTQPLQNCDLPSALKNEKASIFTNYRNPVVPKIGVNPDPKFRASAATSVFDQGSMDEKFVVTPLGTVAENSFSGISVEMMAFSKEQYDDEKDDDHRSIHSKSSFRGSDQFEIDELILDNSFETMPFTQPDVEAAESGLGRIDPQFLPHEEQSDVVENERLAQKALNSMNCDDDSKYLQPGAKAFGIPYGLGGNQSYLRCIVIDQRITTSCTGASDRVQYYVEFQDKRLKSKKQYILSRKIMSSNCMKTRINVALDEYQETENPSRMASLIKLVADELHVCHDLVRVVASNRVKHAPKGGKTVSQGKHNRIIKKRKSGALGSSGE